MSTFYGWNPAKVPGPGVDASSEFGLTTRVELQLSAKTLLDFDVLSPSDPVCILYQKDPKTSHYVEMGRTEIIMNDLNPGWNKKFILDYHLEERQILKFVVYDWDSEDTEVNLGDHHILGSLECELAEIVAATPNHRFDRNLVLPPSFEKFTSKLIIVPTTRLNPSDSNPDTGKHEQVLRLKLSAKNLDKKDFWGKSDPFVVISKKWMRVDGAVAGDEDSESEWTHVHRTEIIKNTLNPQWRQFPISLPLFNAANGGVDGLGLGAIRNENLVEDGKLRFTVLDWNDDWTNDFIGEFETTYAQLLTAYKVRQPATFPLLNAKKRDKKAKKSSAYTNSGLLTIDELIIEDDIPFLHHIHQGRVQLKCAVAVDFSKSNRVPIPGSKNGYTNLHPQGHYRSAIKSVVEIIQNDFINDKTFVALGFGAEIPPLAQVSQEFYLNQTAQSPFCHGIQELLEVYDKCADCVIPKGQACLAPSINHVARLVSEQQEKSGQNSPQNYFVLVIFTQGTISDSSETSKAILASSTLPMSILIVGVEPGRAYLLDKDGKYLRPQAGGGGAGSANFDVRNNLQCLELRKYKSTSFGQEEIANAKICLTNKLLDDIPGQVCEFMRMRERQVHPADFQMFM